MPEGSPSNPSYESRRPLTQELRAGLRPDLADKLQQAVSCIPLTGFPALRTAVANDIDPILEFAQLVMALGRPGSLFVGLSTSGTAANVCAAAEVARARGLKVLGLTGERWWKTRPSLRALHPRPGQAHTRGSGIPPACLPHHLPAHRRRDSFVLITPARKNVETSLLNCPNPEEQVFCDLDGEGTVIFHLNTATIAQSDLASRVVTVPGIDLEAGNNHYLIVWKPGKAGANLPMDWRNIMRTPERTLLFF
jgi:hypothetical protein